jgi:acyl carrier protein
MTERRNAVNITEDVKQILREALNLESIDDGACMEQYSEWDSLTYIRIVAALESKYNICVTGENINNFNSVRNIVAEIEKIHDPR